MRSAARFRYILHIIPLVAPFPGFRASHAVAFADSTFDLPDQLSLLQPRKLLRKDGGTEMHADGPQARKIPPTRPYFIGPVDGHR